LRVAWIADTHIPYHDQKAIATARGVLESYKPDVVIFGGDLIDCVGISKYSKAPLDPVTNNFQKEIDRFQDIFADLVKSAGKAQKFALPGNHEARLGKLLRDRAPALFGLDVLQLPKLLQLDRFGVSFFTQVTVGGNVVFTHGDMVRKQSGGSVMSMLESDSYGHSMVIGHCHRIGLVYKSRPGLAPIFGLESGHLCDPAKLDYLQGGFANWQTGCSIVTFRDGVVIPQPIPFYRVGSGWRAGI